MYNETIKTWIDALLEHCGKSNVSELIAEEIKEEIKEVEGSVENEKLWSLSNPVNPIHLENIALMNDYLDYLEELLEGKEG